MELVTQLCMLCVVAKHTVDIRLHYIIASELVYWICNLSLHYRIGFELIV